MSNHNSREIKPHVLGSSQQDEVQLVGRLLAKMRLYLLPLGVPKGKERSSGRGLLLIFVFLSFPVLARSQMMVYTVAGNINATSWGDGGPAINAQVTPTEGVWIDGNCNLYFCEHSDIRKVNLSNGIITTVAGQHSTSGYSGDGGPATDALMNVPYGIYSDSIGNLYFADRGSVRIRKVDAASGMITTFAGGGPSLGDGGLATNAQLNTPISNVYGDKSGNFYIGELARIRKVDAVTGIISTIAGNGTCGLSGDGGLAINAQLCGPSGMLFDNGGNLIFADRSNSRIRKINLSTGIITTIAGTTNGLTGDGGPAIDAQLSGPISFVIDIYGNIVIGDNQNNLMRKVDATTGIITTIAGSLTASDTANYAVTPATAAYIHPEFMYLDHEGNIYFTNWGGCQVRKITNYNPGLNGRLSICSANGIENISEKKDVAIYPNPAYEQITITANSNITSIAITDLLGQAVLIRHISSTTAEVNITGLSPGIYFVTVTDENNNKVVRKIVKQ